MVSKPAPERDAVVAATRLRQAGRPAPFGADRRRTWRGGPDPRPGPPRLAQPPSDQRRLQAQQVVLDPAATHHHAPDRPGRVTRHVEVRLRQRNGDGRLLLL